MIIQEIYYMLLRKLCLTGLYLKSQESKIYKQVDTHAGFVNTVRGILKDRSTHMQDVSTQSAKIFQGNIQCTILYNLSRIISIGTYVQKSLSSFRIQKIQQSPSF